MWAKWAGKIVNDSNNGVFLSSASVNKRSIPILINSCLKRKKFPTSSGNQSRDFLYIDDGVDAIIKSIKSINAKGKIFNIGLGKAIKLKKIMKIVEKKLKYFSPIYGQIKLRKGEAKILYPNVSLAKKILKWKSNTAIKAGLTKTMNYYKNKKWKKS